MQENRGRRISPYGRIRSCVVNPMFVLSAVLVDRLSVAIFGGSPNEAVVRQTAAGDERNARPGWGCRPRVPGRTGGTTQYRGVNAPPLISPMALLEKAATGLIPMR
jgi:hypothetical protein